LIIALTVIAFIVIAGFVFYALSLISNALIVLLISALLAYMIYPFIQFLRRFLPMGAAVTLAYLAVVLLLGGVLYFVADSLVRQIISSVQGLQALFGPQGNQQLQPIIDLLERFGITQQQINVYRGQILAQLQNFIAGLIPFLSGLFSNFITFIIILTLSIYFVLDGPRIIRWLHNKSPRAQREEVHFLLHTLDRSVGGYFRGLLLLAAIGAVSTGIVLTLLHVPYAALLALLFFLLFFIPMIGGYISGILTVLAAIPQGWVTVLIVIAFTVLLQQIVLGQVLAPRVYSQSIGLHPIVALFALLAGSQLFGVLGGFFSVPIAGVLQELVVSTWKRWEARHPDQFDEQKPAQQAGVVPEPAAPASNTKVNQ
jgi:predicted PurR-regulated permease PerM